MSRTSRYHKSSTGTKVPGGVEIVLLNLLLNWDELAVIDIFNIFSEHDFDIGDTAITRCLRAMESKEWVETRSLIGTGRTRSDPKVVFYISKKGIKLIKSILKMCA